MTLDPIDMIRQLVAPHQHAEAFEYDANGTRYTTRHTVTAPALLDQLNAATPIDIVGGATGSYTSKPAGNIEAIDTLIRIDLEAARWVRTLGHDDPGNTAACVRLAGSMLTQTTPCQLPTAERRSGCCLPHDVARWWSQARIVSGWDTPAWKPNNTCPLCGRRGSLRIRATDKTALCIDCRTTWDASTIGLLAEHIRLENHDTTQMLDTSPDDPPHSSHSRSVPSGRQSPEPHAGALVIPRD